jgi:ubiquinone/menaquinone biosynthesis C-methylase UbiE
MGSPSTLPPSAPLWQRLWRRPFFKRGFYEVLGLMLWRRKGLQLLNCGYAGEGYPRFALPPEDEPERLGFQLYHRLVRGTPLAGRDVVEIGCGRGGGARFLARECGPLRFIATDASHLLILGNRQRAKPLNLEFRAALAVRLPLPAESCDVVISVEAIHPQPDKAAVLAESARVLRPGGRMLVADFFYTRDSSPNAASLFRSCVSRSPFKTVLDEDWTAQAVAAMEEDSPRRFAEIDKLPRFMRKAALSFAGTVRSPLYTQLRNGQARYLHFCLEKASAPARGV